MIKTYRKKPIIIEAVQWTGKNREEIEAFTKGKSHIISCNKTEYCSRRYNCVICVAFLLYTPKGDVCTTCGAYIIKSLDGEFFPCDPAVFEKIYEEVTDI